MNILFVALDSPSLGGERGLIVYLPKIPVDMEGEYSYGGWEGAPPMVYAPNIPLFCLFGECGVLFFGGREGGFEYLWRHLGNS